MFSDERPDNHRKLEIRLPSVNNPFFTLIDDWILQKSFMFFEVFYFLINSIGHCTDISSLIQANQEGCVNKNCESGTSCE